MTNIKATKRALGSSMLALFLCFAMLLGTTFAWFTDSVTSNNNIITAGNLDVELEYKKIVDGKIADKWESVNEETKLFDEATLWEPGHAEVVYLKVSNLGTLDLKYQLSVTVLTNKVGYTADDKMIDLRKHLVFKVVELEENEIGAYDSREAVVDAKDAMGLNNYLGTTKALDAKDGANDEDYVALIVYMPETVGNEANYRGEDVPYIKLGVDLFATQYTSESDSFGDDYDTDANEGFKVTTGADLQAAIDNAQPGDTIVLENDIVAEEPIVIAAPAATTYAMRNVNATVIDLNGKTLTADIIVSKGAVAVIKNGNIKNYSDDNSAIETVGNLTLDNLTITSTRHAVRVEGGVTVINGGTYKVGGYAGRTQHAVNVSDGGEVVINGGNFVGPKDTASDSGAAVNVQADSTVTINGGNFSGGKTNTVSAKGTLVVKGGTFDQDPSNVKFKDRTDNYVAEDCKVTKVADSYIVTSGDTNVVTNADELVAALEAGKNVIFANDIKIEPASMSNAYGKTGINVKNGQTIDGNGYVLDIKGAGGTWDSGICTTGGVIKNITVTGSFRGIFIKSGTERVVLENVTLTGVTYTISCDAAGKQGLTATNCTFNGWTSFAATLGEAKFVNCNFGEGNGYKYCRPYAPTTFENCTFSAGYSVDTTRTENTFVNCTWVVTTLDAMQKKINSAVNGTTILLGADIAGDVTVEQKADVKITIDGNGKTFAGTITVDGKSHRYETAGVTIKNVNFDAKDISADAYINLGKEGDINNTRYTNNVTVEDCTFKGYGDNEVDGAVAVKSYTGGDLNLKIDGCTVYAGMHSMLQVTNVEKGLTIVDCKVYSKNGVNLNNTPSVEMSGCEFDVRGYAIRVGTSGAATAEQKNFSVVDCTLKAACTESDDAVIIFRGTATNAKLDLTGTTLEGKVEMSGNTASTVIVK